MDFSLIYYANNYAVRKKYVHIPIEYYYYFNNYRSAIMYCGKITRC
jgi:hypothetical protein